jgi:hypothetical protein
MAIAATSMPAPMAAVHAQPYPPAFGALASAAAADATSVSARAGALLREAEGCEGGPTEAARIIAAAETLEAEARNIGIRADAIADAAAAANDPEAVEIAREAERMAAEAEEDAQEAQETARRGCERGGKVNNTNNNNNVDPEAVYEDFGDEDRHHRRGFRNCGEDCCGEGCCEGGCGGRVGRELPFTGAPVTTVATLGGGLLAMGTVGVLVPVRRRRSTSVK